MCHWPLCHIGVKPCFCTPIRVGEVRNGAVKDIIGG